MTETEDRDRFRRRPNGTEENAAREALHEPILQGSMARSRIEILLIGAAAVVTACGSEGAASKARNEGDASSGGGNGVGGVSTGGSTAGGGRIDSGGQATGGGGRQQAGGANSTGGKSSGGSSNGGSVAGGGTAGAGGSPPGADAGPSDVISGRHPGDWGKTGR